MHRFSVSARPEARNIVLQRDTLRISLLTPELLRVETGNFTDLPTQTVWNRDLGEIPFSLEETGGPG